ncbi:polyprenyl synthetase family protein [Fuchsiella alkaliacetigena]|uniref:polyprenyl synthetase family protein n=1 Tax=Fuchsiella alkaliacetigena TaxID=957042 RepID=UPI00200A2BE6|nr:polyprenyl synthetase family protein [Fuchsiella alkaliacetigena]MCK8824439.1 polyprenyl synthetase family protein [Fuchsiella alkaliacetigena]
MFKSELLQSSDISNELQKVEDELQKLTESKFSLLYRISNRLLQAGGKRLRPLLVLLAGRLSQLDLTEQLIPAASSVELIHMATLIHDDIIDDSTHRRGETTINKDWGNTVAVLSGDLLYTRALKQLTEYETQDLLVYMLDVVALICEGEAKQAVTNYDLDQGLEDYLERITKKTALLISASCKLGAMVSGTSEEQIAAMETYGEQLGIAFQIINDLNDIVAEKDDLGKEPGDDLRQGTLTLPMIFALESAEQADFLAEVIAKQENSTQEIERALEIIKSSGAVESSIEFSQQYINRALECLDLFADSTAKNSLQLIAQNVINSYKGLKPLEIGAEG